MLVAAWVLAIATAVLALSVPVAWFTWLSVRRQDRERQQRARDQEAEDRIMQRARQEFPTMEGIRKEFVSKEGARSTVSLYALLAGIMATGLVGAWVMRRGEKPGT